MTTVLITGCAGLVGSNLAEHLLKKGVTVIGIDDLSGGYIENVPSGVIFCQGSCNDSLFVDGVFKIYAPEVVYHAAAYAAENLSPFIRTFNYNSNLVATSVIVNGCINHDVKRLVFFSSIAVYGNIKGPFHETDYCWPNDPYGNAKLACERDIQIAGEQHGLDWCIVRPYNIYGERQNIWDKYRNVFGIWMLQILNDKPVTVYGTGQQRRAFTYIGDVLQPLWEAGTSPQASKQIINLGSPNGYKIIEAISVLCEVVKTEVKIEFLEGRHEVKDAVCQFEKAQKLLYYEHKTDLYNGLKKMWEWAKEQPKREVNVWGQYEVEKGIYEYWKK